MISRIVIIIVINLWFLPVFPQEIKINEPLMFLALGDSYTIGQSVAEKDRWPVQLGARLTELGVNVEKVQIRARTGWTTGNLLNSLASEPVNISPNLVSLLIGVNNQYQGRSKTEYTEQFKELLIKALDYVDGDPRSVFVLSIPDYGYTPFGNGAEYISREIDIFNDINREIAREYDVTYIDITGISRDGLSKPEYVASDGLHPSGIQYELWVNEVLKFIPLSNTTLDVSENSSFVSDLFPNPFTDKVKIEFSSFYKTIEISVYDITGNLRDNVVFYEKDFQINLGHLEPGIYFIRILKDGHLLETHKIIKK